MTSHTGEFPLIMQSGFDVRPRRTDTGTAGRSHARQLLSDAPAELAFNLRFWNGDRLSLTLSGSGTEPSWHWRVFSAIRRLGALAPNWDSYGAAPLSAAAVQRLVLQVLPALPDNAPEPAVVPTRDGGLQLEWHPDGVDFEIAVPPAGPLSYLLVDERTGDEHEWGGTPALHTVAIRDAFARLMAAA